jgi:hypothetical protein
VEEGGENERQERGEEGVLAHVGMLNVRGRDVRAREIPVGARGAG